MATATLISVEEYLALNVPGNLLGYEYDEGRVIEVSAHARPDARLQLRVGHLLSTFLDTAGLAIDILDTTGYWVTPEVERIPDLSLVLTAKADAMEIFRGSLRGAPDVAIEIVSPSESAAELHRKTKQYLAAGVQVVIQIYADTRTVDAWRPNGEARSLGPGDTLEIPELLPGFKLPVDEIFAA